MVDVGVEYDVTVPRITSSDDEEFGDHSLPNANEVKNLKDFADDDDNKKSKKRNYAGLGWWAELSRKQKYIVGGVVGGLLIIILAMSIALATVRPSRMNDVVNFLSDNFADRTALEENDSPQKKAAKWIADQDPLNMPMPASNGYEDAYKFVQRYALAVLYFAWGGDEEWVFDYNFLSKKDECDWNTDYKTSDSDQTFQLGVRCNDDKEVDYLFMRKCTMVMWSLLSQFYVPFSWCVCWSEISTIFC